MGKRNPGNQIAITKRLLKYDTPKQQVKMQILKMNGWDFPRGPVVKTSPSSAGGASLIPGWEAQIPQNSEPKNQNNIVVNSIKTLKMVHIHPKKKSLKKKMDLI